MSFSRVLRMLLVGVLARASRHEVSLKSHWSFAEAISHRSKIPVI